MPNELKTHKFARKTFYVDAARVSDNNMELVAEWCKGEIKEGPDGKYIEVDVYKPMNDRQKQAFAGDWVLYAGSGFKVYTSKAFDKSFEKVKTLSKPEADAAGIKVPHEPRPKKKFIPRELTQPVLDKDAAEKLNNGLTQDKGPQAVNEEAPKTIADAINALVEKGEDPFTETGELKEAQRQPLSTPDPEVSTQAKLEEQVVDELVAKGESRDEAKVKVQEGLSEKKEPSAEQLIQQALRTPLPGGQS